MKDVITHRLWASAPYMLYNSIVFRVACLFNNTEWAEKRLNILEKLMAYIHGYTSTKEFVRNFAKHKGEG